MARTSAKQSAIVKNEKCVIHSRFGEGPLCGYQQKKSVALLTHKLPLTPQQRKMLLGYLTKKESAASFL